MSYDYRESIREVEERLENLLGLKKSGEVIELISELITLKIDAHEQDYYHNRKPEY